MFEWRMTISETGIPGIRLFFNSCFYADSILLM